MLKKLDGFCYDQSHNWSCYSQLIGLVLSREALSAELEGESSQPQPRKATNPSRIAATKKSKKHLKPEKEKERGRDWVWVRIFSKNENFYNFLKFYCTPPSLYLYFSFFTPTLRLSLLFSIYVLNITPHLGLQMLILKVVYLFNYILPFYIHFMFLYFWLLLFFLVYFFFCSIFVLSYNNFYILHFFLFPKKVI